MDKLWFFPTILRVREVGDTAVQIKKLYNNGVRMFILAPCFEYIDGTEKNLERLEAYGRSGIIQGKNLIVTSETLDRPLTRTTASRKLREYGLI